MNALEQRDVELADDVIAFDDEVDRRYSQIQRGDPVAARAADPGRERPAARARDAAREPSPRAHGRLLRDDREADEARRRRRARADALAGSRRWASGAEEMIRVALDSFANRDLEARRVARRPGRADRPREPPLRRARDRARRRARPARMGPADDARLARARADRRPRRRHRRAGRLPGDGEFREFTDASHPENA